MRHISETIAVLTDEYLEYRKLVIDQIALKLGKANYGTLCITGRELDPAPSYHQDYSVCNAIYTATRDYQLSGIVLLSGALGSNSSIERIERFSKTFNKVPLVSFGYRLSNVPSVIINEETATYSLYKHVLSENLISKIAFIAGKDNDAYSIAREQCFRKIALQQGYPDSSIFRVHGNYSAIDTYEAVTTLLSEHPDINIIAAANDLMAENATRAIHALGLKIPADIVICGFDDTKEATQVYPAITTVRQPLLNAATQCAELILSCIQSKETTSSVDAAQCIEARAELVIRESTAGSLTGQQSKAQTEDDLAARLFNAMSGLEQPDDICLTELARALWTSINHDSDAIDRHLQQCLHRSPPRVGTIHWWSNVVHQLQNVVANLHDNQTSISRIAVITSAIASVRQHIWTISMDIEVEKQRMNSVRTAMQLQMSSCVKQSDILDTMKRWLQQTDIERCYLVRYQTPGPLPDTRAQLLQAYVNGIVEQRQSDYFDSCQLLPDRYKQVSSKVLLVQTPIYAGRDLFGYLLIDPSDLDYLYLDNAAQSIGNALRNQHLIEQLEQRTCNLQTTNKELVKLANYDELTGLPNRLKFNSNLNTCVEQSKLDSETLTLFFIDLDGFKLVNDTLGHRAGDELLREVASRLNTATHAAIGSKGCIARLGGDEFTITITGINERSHIEEIADTLLNSLARPYCIAKNTINISASIGMADMPTSADNMDSLIKNADSAMYRAKEKGKNCAAWYTAELSVLNDTLLQMDNDMRIALSNGDICMHYQPRINMATGKLSAVEALMRWTINTPEGRKTRTRPDVFIAVAERTGFITQLDKFALDESCRQARVWELAGTPLLVAVNISVLHLQQDDFVETVLQTLAKYQLSAHLLELEITESAVMTQVETNVEKLHLLRNYGIQLSIDDFGTGYSSLSYLKELPVNNLKIDKSFIADVESLRTRRSADAAIIKSVIALGKSMDFQIIAEGIETEPQRLFLKALGCHEAQGFLFARPGPADDVKGFLDMVHLRNGTA
ncbi:MAG: EAL domain-containing protein [Granulosicoccus sp.]